MCARDKKPVQTKHAAARPQHLLLGESGEELTSTRVIALGWKILARNWRPEQEIQKIRDVHGENAVLEPEFRGLELDLVAMDGETLVFVEVRTRTISSKRNNVDERFAQTKFSPAQFAPAHLDPARLFSPSKQKRFLRAARCWLLLKDMWQFPCRFDLFCLGYSKKKENIAAPGQGLFALEHYRNVLEENSHALDSGHTPWQPW